MIQVSQGHFLLSFEYFQGWRVYSFSWQSVPVFDHLHRPPNKKIKGKNGQTPKPQIYFSSNFLVYLIVISNFVIFFFSHRAVTRNFITWLWVLFQWAVMFFILIYYLKKKITVEIILFFLLIFSLSKNHLNGSVGKRRLTSQVSWACVYLSPARIIMFHG